MPPVTIFLIVVSFAVLVLGLIAWRLTSSRSVMFNTLLSSTGLLFAGYFAAAATNVQLSYIIPFLIGMAFGGRGAALWWRGRRGEKELALPATILIAVGVLALGAAVTVFAVT